MKVQLPPPANWQDFEDLCCRLWAKIWNDPDTQKHGRQGQPQAGVDVFGRPDRGESWAGVQCKGKNNYGDSKLAAQEIRDEVDKAKSFQPPLAEYIIATSGRTHGEMQEVARKLTDQHMRDGLFSVTTFCWEEIVERLRGFDQLHGWYLDSIRMPEGLLVAPSRLPNTGELLVGRDEQLKLLDEAWEKTSTQIFSLVAWGGVGKTALVKHWLGRMAANGWRGAERVFDWSFYSQGISDRAASGDAFIDAALRWFGDKDPAEGTPWDKGARLARLVCQYRTLLVLDGLEPLQYGPGGQQGQLKDPAVATLLKGLCGSNPGLCVLTTREAVREIAGHAAASGIELERLSREAGVQLLGQFGVKGSDQDLGETVDEVKGHALTLKLLGNYLRKAWGGDIGKRYQVKLGEADEKQGGHARKVMEAYERWLGEGPELSILRLMGLFDRPAEAGALAALREPPAIPGLTEQLTELGEADWNWAVASLRECGLAARASERKPGTVDAHPLVREHFEQRLGEGPPEAVREAHRRLFEYYRGQAPKLPETLEEMQPLYRAVVHGCRAELHQPTLDEVYWTRMRREEEFFTAKKLGALAAELEVAASFFERRWDRPSAKLKLEDRTFLLNLAGYLLRALGRLEEAVQPIRAALRAWTEHGRWPDAAVSSTNLSELELLQGRLDSAERQARKGVDLADRSQASEAWQRQVINRAALADTLHQRGRKAEAKEQFVEAEAIQNLRQPERPLLYSLQGFEFCDLLLGELEAAVWRSCIGLWSEGRPVGIPAWRKPSADSRSVFGEVRNRASGALQWATSKGFLLDMANDHLTLGRTYLLESMLTEKCRTNRVKERKDLLAQAASFLKHAVLRLRQAGHREFLARGLIVRACFRGITKDEEGALAELAEAEQIAHRGPMRLHLADVRLNRARQRLGWHLRSTGIDSDRSRHRLEEIHQDFDEAKRLINECGYHRRDPEIGDLERALSSAEGYAV